MSKDIINQYRADNIHPAFSVDCVILSYHNQEVKILLSKFQLGEYWSLPGGFMFNHENSDQAAIRILKDRTQLENIFLKQFYLFSDLDRTLMPQNEAFVDSNMPTKAEGNWLLRRFISLGYYALVKYEDIVVEKDDEETKWFGLSDLPVLYSDHAKIIETAVSLIPQNLSYIHVAHQILPKKFTMVDIRRIYEALTDEKQDRRNFQRKILSTGYFIQLNERVASNAYNPPLLYSFDESKLQG